MGNNASTPQQQSAGAGGSHGGRPPAGARGSPRSRNVALPHVHDDPRDPRSRQHSSGSDRKASGSSRKGAAATAGGAPSHPAAGSRDAAHGSSSAAASSSTPSSPGPALSSSTAQQVAQPSTSGAPAPGPSASQTRSGQRSPPPPRHSSSSSAGLGLLGSVGGPRRKLSDRIPIVQDNENDGDAPDDDDEGGRPGTLRDALQGKAEHVVYGPRRADEDDESRNVLLNPPSATHQETLSKPVGIAIPGVGPTAIPLGNSNSRGYNGNAGGETAGRAGGGAAGGGGTGSLSNAGMGAIGATPLMDPDDQTHPGFGASARLTSEVMASTDRMPVVNSPKQEDLPSDSPFASSSTASLGTKTAAPSETEPTTPTPGDTSTANSTAAPTPSHSHEMLLDPSGSRRQIATPQTSFAGALASVLAPSLPITPHSPLTPPTEMHHLPPPHTSSPTPPIAAPNDTVLAPPVPDSALPIASDEIPSGTSVIASPSTSVPGTPGIAGTPSPAVLLPPAVFNAPVAAIPIPILSVPSQTVAQNLMAAAVDLGAGDKGVPTLIKWKDEDGQEKGDGSKGRKAKGPKEVFVTGTFAKGWKTKIELRKTDSSDFSALISLPPGPHRLKFIVDNEWKASKHLPVATDADGNLINYLQVNAANSKLPPNIWQPPASTAAASAAAASPSSRAGGANTATPPPGGAAVPPSSTPTNRAGQVGAGLFWPFGGDDEDPALAAGGAGAVLDVDEDDSQWTQEIPTDLVKWGEWEAERDAIENEFYAQHPDGPSDSTPPPEFPAAPPFAGVQPPTLPAQLEKGPLNHAAYVTQGSGDDNSILPKPDHSVINHLAASPIKGGFLSVGVTTRYKRKFVTIVYYKALSSR